LENHESFLVCPGKSPVKIGQNQPVSIQIYFDNFIHREKNRHHHNKRDNGEIYLLITDGGLHDNYNNHDNQLNDRINAHHQELLKANGRDQKIVDNKSSEINLIESNRNIKNINRNDGNIKHFIHIYFHLENRQQKVEKTVFERKANK
jgi:hypothetical protein